jgi:hypothetical protein
VHVVADGVVPAPPLRLYVTVMVGIVQETSLLAFLIQLVVLLEQAMVPMAK